MIRAAIDFGQFFIGLRGAATTLPAFKPQRVSEVVKTTEVSVDMGLI